MSEKVYLYLPDDEPDQSTFNGHVFHLQPNASTEIVSPWPATYTAQDIAAHIVEKLGRWGVCIVKGPVKDCKAKLKADQATVDAAELRYLKGTKEWAEQHVMAYESTAKAKRDVGLDAEPEDEGTAKARAWLKKYRPRLKTAGLIA